MNIEKEKKNNAFGPGNVFRIVLLAILADGVIFEGFFLNIVLGIPNLMMWVMYKIWWYVTDIIAWASTLDYFQ